MAHGVKSKPKKKKKVKKPYQITKEVYAAFNSIMNLEGTIEAGREQVEAQQEAS